MRRPARSNGEAAREALPRPEFSEIPPRQQSSLDESKAKEGRESALETSSAERASVHTRTSDEFPHWKFDGISPAERYQDLREWTASLRLTAQQDFLVNPVVDAVRMGLGWDGGADVDASVVLCDERGRVVDVVWYKKLRSTCGSVVHSGDNLTGVGDGDDEVISVGLSDIPLHVDHLLFTVCLFSYGMSFNEVRSAYVRMIHDGETQRNEEMCCFSLSEMSGKAMLMGLLTRRGACWNFKALGTPATGRTVAELLQNPYNLACLSESPAHKPELRYVTVSVIRGRGLAAKDRSGFFRKVATSDPYFTVEFRNKKYTSEYKSRTLEPEWKSPSFSLGYLTEVEQKPLIVQIFDYDVVGAHDFMGTVRVAGYEIYSLGEGEHTFWFTLDGTKEKAHRNEVVTGEILVSFRIEVTSGGLQKV